MIHKIILKKDKETPKYFRFRGSDDEVIGTVYLVKELFVETPEEISILVSDDKVA